MHWQRTIGIGGLLIIAALVTVYVVLANYDYNKFKPQLAEMVKDATGRDLHLGGDLKLSIGFAPALVVNDAALANAPWGSQPEMIKVDNLRLKVRLLPLLSRTVELTHIVLTGVEVLLETDANGQHNWVFEATAKPGKENLPVSASLKWDLDRMRISNLMLLILKGKVGKARRFHLTQVDLARHADGGTQTVDLHAEYNNQPVVITGTTGAIEQLWARQSFPVNLSGTYSGVRATVDGKIDEVLRFKGVDLNLKVSGQELADLGPLVATQLPVMGAFDVQGHMTGSATSLALKQLTARLDKSDFKGHAKFELQEKPKMTIRLDSSLVDLSAVLDHLEKNKPRPAGTEKPRRQLFSDASLPLDALQNVEADIVLKAEHIHARGARLELGHLALILQDRDFRIEKFEATYKATRMKGRLSIEHGEPPRVVTNFLVQNFNLGEFLKETGRSDEVQAVIDIAAHGKSRGTTVSSLMANLDGAIGFVMGKGYLTHYLDMLSAGLSQKVINYWNPPKEVDQINCAVVQFDIHNGVAASRAFVFNTRVGIITGEGVINLGTEKIDFLLVPKSKHPELRVVPKLRVSGSVLAPEVSVAKLSLLSSGARGLSTLVVGPAGLLAPFVHLGADNSHPCGIEGLGQGAPEISEEAGPSSP